MGAGCPGWTLQEAVTWGHLQGVQVQDLAGTVTVRHMWYKAALGWVLRLDTHVSLGVCVFCARAHCEPALCPSVADTLDLRELNTSRLVRPRLPRLCA